MASKKKEVDANLPIGARLNERQLARIEHRATLQQQCEELLKQVPPYVGLYTDTLGEALATMLSIGVTLDQISSFSNKMPTLYTLLKWARDEKHPFCALYNEAKQLLVTLYEERALSEALKSRRTVLKTKRQAIAPDGKIVTLHEEREVDNVERSKLIVGTYGWTLGHLAPKKHGRKPSDEGEDGKTEGLKSLFESIIKPPAPDPGQ